MRLIGAGLAWLVVLALPGETGAAPCEASRVFKVGYSGTVVVPVEAASFDSVFADTWTSRVTFDRRVGQASLSASSSGRFEMQLRVIECFDIVGVPPGTPIDATLLYELTGSSSQNCGGSGCGVRLEATVAVGADSSTADANQAGPGGSTRPLAATISVPIHFVAGAPIRAQFLLWYGTGPGGGNAVAEAYGTWRVSGLPPGVRAVGATGADLTPTTPTSWGRLKARFRR